MATNTYVALQTSTVTSSTAYVEFTSIPQTYTDLVIVWTGTSSNNTGYGVRFNSDSGSNYSLTYLYGDGSTAVSGRDTNTTAINGMGRTGTSQGVGRVNVMNYSNTTTYKTALGRGDLASQLTMATVGTWRSTAAITTVRLTPEAGTISAGTFTLYGIAAASVGAKATGGTIYQDASYFYHVFSGNGTFTPSQALTADILAVAGGGGAGYAYGGGGGAGGLLYASSQSLGSGTAYTCTVGAGGNNGVNGSRVGVQGVNSSISGSGFTTLTAIGGGGGGANQSGNQPPTSGGSGGGASGDGSYSGSGGTATSGQGYAGGAVVSGNTGGSGGGGAGAVGTAVVGNQTGANGGIGSATYSSWGVATGIGQAVSGTYYLAGGGAGSGGTGGSGGGANPAGSGRTNTGGGGGSDAGTGAGGSGVIIVRYSK